MICIQNLWAKTEPFQSVVTHGRISGIIGQELTNKLLSCGTRKQLADGIQLPIDELPSFIGYFVSLHDIGKIHYSFQSKDPGMKEMLKQENMQGIGITDPQFRHEAESGRAMKRIWTNWDRRTASTLAEILAAHHQGKPQNPMQQNPGENWIQMQREYEKTMRGIFMADGIFPKIEKEKNSVIAALLLGVTILADWIASGDIFDDAESWPDFSETVSEKAEAFLKDSGLAQEAHPYGREFSQVWPNIPKGSEREIQSVAETLFQRSENRYSLMLMEAPMGEGKTEAGVYAALQMVRQWGKNGFYVALPTSATANQMVGRMRALLSKHNQKEPVKLLHSMAWMVDETSSQVQSFSTEDEAIAHNWLMPMRRGLLAPYAVGTVDQAMMAAMFIKYGVLRLLGLSGKALIIDEIHAYDTYMQNILERLLEWCKALEIPVVLLSATLPPEKKKQLLGIYTKDPVTDCYPAIYAVDEDGRLLVEPVKKVAKHQTYGLEFWPILHEPEKIAQAAIEKVHGGGCLCVLLNTVGQAQEVYSAIKKRDFSGRLMLFHSRFLAKRRDEIEKECIRCFGKNTQYRPQQAILVATQVVEQSLDVDFDFFISAVAPIDLLIQRMGRQFRHEETPRPVKNPMFSVLIPTDGEFGSDGYVYPNCLLNQTVHLLKGQETIRVPEDLAQLVADGYDSSKVPPEELESWMEHLMDDSIRGAMADGYKLLPPSKKFRPLADPVKFDDLESQSYLSAQTRLSEPTVRIALLETELYERLLPQEKDGFLAVQDQKLAREILERSVTIRKKIYDRISQESTKSDLTGYKLIAGVKILETSDLRFWDDPELGVLWKEAAI